MKLVVLANGFPYGPWEPFLETEVKYYRGFDAVHICAMQLRRAHRSTLRPLPSEDFHVCPVPFSLAACIPGCFRALADRQFYGELRRLIKERRVSLSRLAWLFFYLSRSYHEAAVIGRYLKKTGLAGTKERVVLYSYRFDYQPYVALLLKKRYLPNSVILARGHRYDLYEDARSNGYIPLRPALLDGVDRVALIAEDGRRYLASRYPAWADKLTVSRLGTEDHGVCPAPAERAPLRLVSCSTLTAQKRVALIAQALALLGDMPVVWTHYGDGPLRGELETLCRQLPDNIRWTLRGHVDNRVLLGEYASTPWHLFLNVSASEGVPVSIMEAMSFSIPAAATDVGGTGELVAYGENGLLLPADLTPARLAEAIRAVADMEPAAYQAMRDQARAFWQDHYDAAANYAAFAAELAALGRDTHG